MKDEDYGFHFEKQGLSGEEGPIDPLQQFFEGSHADHSVVRETGQNSKDNPGKHSSGPVRMVFELAVMNMEDIPGIEGLTKHLEAVAEQTAGQEGHDRMVKAAALAKEETLQVLRISDYNTTGLVGSESLDSKGSPLSRLTRGKGGSIDDGRGGSFGIGSAVGPMASDLCTVIYTSIPEDTSESVLAAYTRLATHRLDGESYRAEGYFTNLGIHNDFKYLRPAPKIGPFPLRSEAGTDTYILGYRMAEIDPELERVRDAMIDNFMAAINAGELVVEGIAPGNHWTLDAETLPGFTKGRQEAHAFYQALQDPNPAEAVINHVGKVKLYINIDDSLEKKLHTITTRAPLMKIDLFKHTSVTAKYAAVLICDSPEGNKYLRQLEPPQHHEWDPARDPLNGEKVISELKVFVRESLKERIGTEIGDEVKIEGLSRFLPASSHADAAIGEPAVPFGNPESDANTSESSTVTGNSEPEEPTPAPPGKKIRVKVRRPAISGGNSETEEGKQRGGKKKRRGDNTGLPGSGEEGEGASRIRGRDLSFRSWSAPVDSEGHSVTVLSITANSDESGDLELQGLGAGGDPEQSYMLPITRAVIHLPDGENIIKCSGNTLKNLTLTAGQKTRIDIYMPAGERYRLGVA
ncbi:hypothetical protein A3709_01820 [Halioglobus sp. HI00S01]|uniref:hypothetical protein n=1 Tax=Halioglobus sp. HI00S01 TaxID=1822214 RepID=UPI0007C2C391|nr:hypothetical protein [Halioglobus sp. HI00S01]KZX58227.1 hypothetical protein A3709_01820 [Halioglobus sp. HI00S01]